MYNNDKLTNLKSKEYEVDENSDIVILGLGFVHVKHSCKVRIHINSLDLIEIRKSFF